MISGFT